MPTCSTGGASAEAGCALIDGLIYNSFGLFVVAPPHPSASQFGNADGFCYANGTTGNPGSSGDAVCGTAVFYLQCSAPTQIQAVVVGSASTVAGNDDSFYSYVDGNRSLAQTVHAAYRVGAWSDSTVIFPSGSVAVTKGPHTITIAEREDGTRIRSIRLTQGQLNLSLPR
jgi:hypothetical protein